MRRKVDSFDHPQKRNVTKEACVIKKLNKIESNALSFVVDPAPKAAETGIVVFQFSLVAP